MDVIDEKHRVMVEAWVRDRPRVKTPIFEHLVRELNNELMAELMWAYWGEGAIGSLDQTPPYLNTHLRWWKFGQEKYTIRKLMQSPNGREKVWQMLNDAGAWL